MDAMVLQTQQWLNQTYGNDSRFNRITENGKTGWDTIYGLRRALQIELGIQQTSNSFGPTTYSLCPNVNQGAEGNIVYIIQGGLWCKGYSPGGFTGYYGNGTYDAVKRLKTDAGFPSASGNMNRDFMRALLDMSAFTLLSGGTAAIRAIQQELNYNYYDYYQICPCDGLYNREMNKMLIYALQCEEGIASSAATGTWGPTTIARCPTLKYGDSNNYVKLVRYALVCNGYSVSTTSNIYNAELEAMTISFANSLLLSKKSNIIDYTIIRSLLSSNGDPDRAAAGCDTATKLSDAQIQTIKSAGYGFVGRYLSNTPGGTLNKALTRDEIERITNAGLKLFYIFQESNNSPSNFNSATGYEQALRAINAGKVLGIPEQAIIYFAVDCDPQDAEVTSNIIPYFKAIQSAFRSFENVKYSIGVYGTRNVCLRLKSIMSISLFVSDASYGFSGNLGFTMPQGWAFDQFVTDLTIGSGAGQVSIDKVGVSYVDNANYGPLIPPTLTPDPGVEEYVTYMPQTNEKKLQGVLKVNMHEGGLRVYRKIHAPEGLVQQRYGLPKDEDLMYVLPQYALYLNIGQLHENKYEGSLLIKFYDSNNNEQYGYIVQTNRISIPGIADPYQPIVSVQLREDINIFKKQVNMNTKAVNSAHNALVDMQFETIEGDVCAVYKLKYSTSYYNRSGEKLGTIAANTKVATDSSNSGQTYNTLVSVLRVMKDGKWEKLTNEKNIFIDYQLENGHMPSDRLLNS